MKPADMKHADIAPADVDAVSAPQHFARVRETFHTLLDLDLARRADALRHIEAADPDFAVELRALMAALDETDLLAAPATQMPARLGPFRLLRSLGRGGMGEVWLAERVEGGFEQQVALKRVRDAALSPELTRRFLRERQILARLVHPNIAHLVDGGFGDDGRPWLAMEYVQGERITVWCAARALDAAARVRLFLPVCEAVQFAHRNLIVHRDLKPANLMIDSEGRPKLLDFGIARLLDGDTADPTQTLAAMTPAYAAPEQRAGGAITTATDVYQLGVVLGELLGGARLDEKRNRSRASDSAERARPPAARLAGDLGLVVAKATAHAAGDRYASVAMLADDLSDWLDHRPLRSGIGSRRERMRRTVWQWRWPLAMLTVVVLAIGAGALLALREARVAQARAAEARSNFDALLGVIGSANPGRYAGREPLAGELLTDAASRLQRDFQHDPTLLHQALGEIGHGLLNLGRPREAETVLTAALDALRRTRTPQARTELGLLKLLVMVQDDAAAIERARASADRIALVAAIDEVPAGLAMDVLASAARSVARLGDFGRARELLAQAERIESRGGSITTSQRENFWRQRGGVALNAMELDAARNAFAESRAAQDAAPHEFSRVRRAELDLLTAETALAAGDASGAAHALAAARPAMFGEYPAGHLERGHFELQEARLALLQNEVTRAHALALSALAVLQSPGGEQSGRALAERVARVARARSGDCAADSEASVASRVNSPRERAETAWMREALRRSCASPNGTQSAP